jgi:hypothetical protein
MTRALALASFAYQSAAAIVLIVCVSHLVRPEVYTTVSLALASAQLASVLTFEWVQLAGIRYLSSASVVDAPRLRVGLFLADVMGAGVLAVATLAALVATRFAPVALPSELGADGLVLMLGIAVWQGLTDLVLTMVRVDGRLARASWLMIMRASLLLAGTVAGAWIDGSARGVLCGNCAGQAASLAVVLATHPDLRRGASWRARRSDLARFCRFGMLAAGASATHMTVPVTIRYLIVGWTAGDPAVTAAASLALDLLQRPFSVLVAAIHTMSYPEVVAAHDRGVPDLARAATARQLEFIACATAVMLGGLIAFLPEAASLVIKADLRPDFVRVGAAATAYYFFHTQLQAALAIVPQVQERTPWLIGVATAHLVVVGCLVLAGVALGASPRDTLLLAAFGTALVAIPAAGPTVSFGAVPQARLVLTGMACAALLSLTALHHDAGPLWLGARIVLSAAIVGGLAWAGDFLQLRNRRMGPGRPARRARVSRMRRPRTSAAADLGAAHAISRRFAMRISMSLGRCTSLPARALREALGGRAERR